MLWLSEALQAKAAHSSQASRIAQSRVDCGLHSFLFLELSRGTWEPHAVSPGASIGPLVAWLFLSGFSGSGIDQALWHDTWLWSIAQWGRLGEERWQRWFALYPCYVLSSLDTKSGIEISSPAW